jgi:hypothetical protein
VPRQPYRASGGGGEASTRMHTDRATRMHKKCPRTCLNELPRPVLGWSLRAGGSGSWITQVNRWMPFLVNRSRHHTCPFGCATDRWQFDFWAPLAGVRVPAQRRHLSKVSNIRTFVLHLASGFAFRVKMYATVAIKARQGQNSFLLTRAKAVG